MVRRILERTRCGLTTLIGNTKVLRSLEAKEFVDDTFGLPTNRHTQGTGKAGP